MKACWSQLCQGKKDKQTKSEQLFTTGPLFATNQKKKCVEDTVVVKSKMPQDIKSSTLTLSFHFLVTGISKFSG